jgi:hypothetical protein
MYPRFREPQSGDSNYTFATETRDVTRENIHYYSCEKADLCSHKGESHPTNNVARFFPQETWDPNVKRQTNKPSSFITSFEHQNIFQLYEFTLQYAFTE